MATPSATSVQRTVDARAAVGRRGRARALHLHDGDAVAELVDLRDDARLRRRPAGQPRADERDRDDEGCAGHRDHSRRGHPPTPHRPSTRR